MEEIPFEAPPDDVADQRAEVRPDVAEDDDRAVPGSDPVPWDADPADVAEQRAEVPLADDEWA